MSNKSYVYPQKTLKQARSKFKMPHQLKTSFNHGAFNLYDIIEVLPGDTFSFDVASLIRMSTPIAPIMDNITMHLAAYFVPNRLSFDNWEQLMGANKSGSWTADDNEYFVPSFNVSHDSGRLTNHYNSYLSQAGLQTCSDDLFVNVLPFRDLAIVWNEYYRNQNVTAPLAVDHSSSNKVLVSDTANLPSSFVVNSAPLKLGKYADMFTKALPEPQKHDPVSFIPDDLIVSALTSDSVEPYNTLLASSLRQEDDVLLTRDSAQYDDNLEDSDIVAKTAGEAWNNINALRFAFQLQKFYEKDARYGSRYFEMLNGHFGVTNPDLVLQRPQFLGEMNWRINVDQVLSTAGYAASSSTTVGAPGANSVTVKKGSLFTGSFTEHGYILIVGGTRHEHTYSDGCDPLWTRFDRLDFYDPVFANIGEQPVFVRQLTVNLEGELTDIFGYQEAWYEYRMLKDKVTGILNPNVSGSLDFWTLADKYSGDSDPELSDDFIYENRDSIKRALVTGSSGPDYIADFYFDVTAVRELPMFSIPGLADHH